MAMPFDPEGSADRAFIRRGRLADRNFAIERLQLIEVDALVVAPDAALGESEGHRWLDSLYHSRLHVGVVGEVEIQAVGPRVHEGLQPCRAGGVLLLQLDRVDEKFHPQVLIDFGLTIGFRETSHRIDVVQLDPIEVVFGLGVDHAEDRVGIGFSVDVRDAPIVADDGDVAGFLIPARRFLVFGRRESEQCG